VRGVDQGWAPGRLGVGVRPLRESDYFLKSSVLYGPVFKSHFFDQPMVAVVGMRAAAELLQEPRLERIRLEYNSTFRTT
jgi:hypothetical protein